MAEKSTDKPVAKLRALDRKQLTDKLQELRAEMVQQQRSLASQELANLNAIKNTRKEIARILTVLNQTSEGEK